jgi:hypothetical protein
MHFQFFLLLLDFLNEDFKVVLKQGQEEIFNVEILHIEQIK